ncbi:MAG: citramalate synthase [Fusobacteriota bacterium]
MRKISIYDTTLRDGSQMKGIAFSVEDKLRIVKQLDKLNIDCIECGWPGSNPRDEEFFKLIKMTKLKNSKIAAFGSTMHPKNTLETDYNLQKLIESSPDVVTIFGKSWDLHVEEALGISLEQNLELITDSIAYLKKEIKEVYFDAEHFFDGYRANPEYAMKVLKAAQKGGADMLVLADTNGGMVYDELGDIVKKVKKTMNTPLGIHPHNDSGLAVANALEGIKQGAVQVQGTINGYGERTGNANLCVVIPNLTLKKGYETIGKDNIKNLTKVSRYISEIANLNPAENMPFVGGNAFAHKGGIHVSAVMKNPKTYEHISPESIGNKRNILVSDLAGKSNIICKAEELGIELDKTDNAVKETIKLVKELENEGYEFEGADGSFELLLKKAMKTRKYFFDVENFRMIIEKNTSKHMISEATVKLDINNHIEHTVSEGDGPVNALDRALRKALENKYPEIKNIELIDYKVRVLNGKDATAAKVRVLIETQDKKSGDKWGTVGVSENIIQASWDALIDSIEIYLNKKR